ncbi:radical SAM protein [uncultured Desulfobacter sp.]|uniref:radical SAM/SPASM domain-containing protein n=1 Tax=uncultured Desulfobacter sp. TaxID=240139 RepID=UPI002AAAF239|nr:radical SAM protein [uncultured Desulfobacter sp.]
MNLTIPDFPARIEIEIASDCNLRCTYCPRHFVNTLKGYIDFHLFEKIIKEAISYPDTILVLHRRGESMLHPEFKKMLELVSGRFKEVQMATNATLLNKDKYEAIVNGLTFLSFSLDTPENFDQTRIPAKYSKVESKILDFLDYNKGRVLTQASMVKTVKTAEEECAKFKSVWTDRVDRVRIYDQHSSDGNFGSLKNPRVIRKPCVMPFYEILVYDSGNVARCNHDWNSDNSASMGDLKKNGIKEIWHGEKYEELRKQQRTLQFDDSVCTRCDCWYPEIGRQGTGETWEKS